jgi:hypothetical protein
VALAVQKNAVLGVEVVEPACAHDDVGGRHLLQEHQTKPQLTPTGSLGVCTRRVNERGKLMER